MVRSNRRRTAGTYPHSLSACTRSLRRLQDASGDWSSVVYSPSPSSSPATSCDGRLHFALLPDLALRRLPHPALSRTTSSPLGVLRLRPIGPGGGFFSTSTGLGRAAFLLEDILSGTWTRFVDCSHSDAPHGRSCMDAANRVSATVRFSVGTSSAVCPSRLCPRHSVATPPPYAVL